MFYKEVDYNNYKDMFCFLRNHFTYDTMNSWNGLKSIAHDVKIWNLPVDSNKALAALEEDEYFQINNAIKDWEDDHPGYEVGFNGRSGGYLVLTNSESNQHVFDSDPDCPCHFDNYQDWKESVEEDYGSLDAYKSTLEFEVKLVQEFDKLCDDLVEVLKDMIKERDDRINRTYKVEATLFLQSYSYENITDMKLHIELMKQRGYAVREFFEDALFAEFEMAEAIHSEVTLEEGDPLLETLKKEDASYEE